MCGKSQWTWEHARATHSLVFTYTTTAPGSSVHDIFQARILEWVAISSSRVSSWSRGQIRISCISMWILYHWATWEALGFGIVTVHQPCGQDKVLAVCKWQHGRDLSHWMILQRGTCPSLLQIVMKKKMNFYSIWCFHLEFLIYVFFAAPYHNPNKTVAAFPRY